ncbi:MAG: nitroreductase family protein, partial [Proteobacteria bacterium]|nr:nitroreductase family protein [Pseudomonadota bacterium]
QPDRYWVNAPKEVQEFMIPAIDKYYRGKEQVQRDEAMRSCGITAQTLMLTAKSMGYDSCPMDGFDFEKVAELIRLPADHVIAMFVAIGKGTKEPWARPGQLDLNEVIIKNSFE